MNIWFQRLQLVLSIGGSFIGLAITFQSFFTPNEVAPLYYAMVSGFVVMYGYGLYAGLRFADDRNDTGSLIVFYWLQVPWISSPVLAYRFTSGFHFSGGIFNGQLNWIFRAGSEWQFSFLQSAPWGAGLNVFALAMALFLMKKRRANQALVPTPMSVTPAAGAPVAPDTGAAHL
jgi:hypothetical protein